MQNPIARPLHRSPQLARAIALALACSIFPSHAAAETAQQTRVVQNCNDSGPGSLREAYAAAVDGDVVDLSQLACSTITLTGGAATSGMNPGTVTLRGSEAHRVAISGNNAGRAIVHSGNAVRIDNLTIRDGTAHDLDGGGCILSEGEVSLRNSTVTDCEVSTTGAVAALGGAVRAKKGLWMLHATISNSRAQAAAAEANGGGVHAGNLTTDGQSSLSGNTAFSADGHPARGGGAFASHGMQVVSTTFSGNHAGNGGAIYLAAGVGSAGSLVNSTISGNEASNAGGGVMSAPPLEVFNSTIASNTSGFDFGAGLYLGDAALLSSSIVAGNTSGGGLNAADVGGNGGITILGGNNLVVASTLDLPGTTIVDDPNLAPLADNGGGVLTHALLAGSPAIDHGVNALGLETDQRYHACSPKCQRTERSVGVATDIGAIEFGAPDRLFNGTFDFEE